MCREQTAPSSEVLLDASFDPWSIGLVKDQAFPVSGNQPREFRAPILTDRQFSHQRFEWASCCNGACQVTDFALDLSERCSQLIEICGEPNRLTFSQDALGNCFDDGRAQHIAPEGTEDRLIHRFDTDMQAIPTGRRAFSAIRDAAVEKGPMAAMTAAEPPRGAAPASA